MSTAREWLRIGKYIILVAIAGAAAWLLAEPFLEAKPNSKWMMSRFSVRVNGTLYMAELREEVSQKPYHLIYDVLISVASVEDPANPSFSVPAGLWPLRMESARGSQRVRLVDVLTGKVVVDEAAVEWLPWPSSSGRTVAPVSWAGNRLLFAQTHAQVPRPLWRSSADSTAKFGRQYHLGVYKSLALKVLSLAAGAVLLVVALAWLLDRLLRGQAPGLCAACGYDLRGTASDRCPECGAEVMPQPVHATQVE